MKNEQRTMNNLITVLVDRFFFSSFSVPFPMIWTGWRTVHRIPSVTLLLEPASPVQLVESSATNTLLRATLSRKFPACGQNRPGSHRLWLPRSSLQNWFRPAPTDWPHVFLPGILVRPGLVE